MEWLAVGLFGLAMVVVVVRYEFQMRAILKRLDDQEERLDAEVVASVRADEILTEVEMNVMKIMHGWSGTAAIRVPEETGG